MPLRFRKSVSLFPGIKLNITKKGLSSLSVGGKGFTQNISTSGGKTTVGLPGSGLSYSTRKGEISGFWRIVLLAALALIVYHVLH